MAFKFKAKPPGQNDSLSMTLFTDASWCPESGAAGWGAWYKCNGMARGEVVGGETGDDQRDTDEGEHERRDGSDAEPPEEGFV